MPDNLKQRLYGLFFLLPATPADRLDQQIQGQVGSRHALITVAEQPNILPFLQTDQPQHRGENPSETLKPQPLRRHWLSSFWGLPFCTVEGLTLWCPLHVCFLIPNKRLSSAADTVCFC